MDKKADLSLNIIIIAVIGLIVLIVLAVIFSGKISLFSKGTGNVSAGYENKCVLPGRECVADCVGSNGVIVAGTFSDCTSPMQCCVL